MTTKESDLAKLRLQREMQKTQQFVALSDAGPLSGPAAAALSLHLDVFLPSCYDDWAASCRAEGRWVPDRPKANIDASLRVSAASDDSVMWLYGAIGERYGGISADAFRRELSSIDERARLWLHIHSEGGDFWDGVAIHEMIRQRPGKTNIVVDSLAASAGSLIAMAGTTVGVGENSWLMIHGVQSVVSGDVDDIRNAVEKIEQLNRQLVNIYKPRWKGTADELRSALDKETWYDAMDAMQWGLADYIVERPMEVAAHIDTRRFKYANVPASLQVAAHASDLNLPKRAARELQLYQALM